MGLQIYKGCRLFFSFSLRSLNLIAPVSARSTYKRRL